MHSSSRIINGSSRLRSRSFMAQPFKHPSTGMYYIRRRVPDELRPSLGLEYKRSLKTRDPIEAKARFAAEWSKSEEAFALAQAQLKGAITLSARDIQQLAARWFRRELAEIEQNGSFYRALVPLDSVIVETADSYEEHHEFGSIRQAIEEGDETDWRSVIQPHIIRSLKSENIPLPAKDSPVYASLAEAFQEHLFKLSDLAKQRDEGNWIIQPGVLEREPLSIEQDRLDPRIGKHELLSVFEAYASAKTLDDGDNRSTRKTLDEFRSTIQRFIELHGNVDISTITRSTIQEYRSQLAQLPTRAKNTRGMNALELIAKANAEQLPRLSSATIGNRLRALSAVLGYAVRMDWLKENPVETSGVARAAKKAAGRAPSRRKDYSSTEIETIFKSPLFSSTGWKPPRRDFGQALYWLPLLMYYTGARREELAQLLTSDVLTGEEGVPHLSILAMDGEDDRGRTVKTLESRRRVPIHDDLIARGFCEYAQSLPTASSLFPMLKACPKGFYGVSVGKAWAEYLRKIVGLRSPASPSHGFRHTFKTLCRAASIPEDIHDAMTGHSSGAVSRDYGSMPLTTMSNELKKYPALARLLPTAQEGA